MLKLAVVSTKGVNMPIERHIPANTTCIVTSGTGLVETAALKYADAHGLNKIIISRDNDKPKELAELIQVKLVVEQADMLLAVWDGKSKCTRFSIGYAKSIGRPVTVVMAAGTGSPAKG